MTPPDLGAVVLAGGRSTRFGRDKLAEPLDGRPLLDHAVEAARAVASEVVVVLAPGSPRSVPAGARTAYDEVPDQGPLAGLAAGLAALPRSIERVLVVAGDMPTLAVAVLRLLDEALAAGQGSAAVVLDAGGPLPMIVRRAPALAQAGTLLARGERRLRALPAALDAKVILGPTWRPLDPDGLTLRDIDRPSDL